MLYSICFGLNCSISYLLCLTFDDNSNAMGSNYNSNSSFVSPRTPKKEIQMFLFSNRWRKTFEDTFGSIYLKHLSKSKDRIVRVCVLHHCAGLEKYCFQSHIPITYLRNKQKYCFSGVALKSIQNNVCTCIFICFYILYLS